MYLSTVIIYNFNLRGSTAVLTPCVVFCLLCVPCRFFQLEAGLLQCHTLLDTSPQDRAAAVDQV